MKHKKFCHLFYIINEFSCYINQNNDIQTIKKPKYTIQ